MRLLIYFRVAKIAMKLVDLAPVNASPMAAATNPNFRAGDFDLNLKIVKSDKLLSFASNQCTKCLFNNCSSRVLCSEWC